MKHISIYDTTLRDGNQAEDVNFSLEDKIKIALKLEEFGIPYIEGGWPGASPVDTAFFQEIAGHKLKNATIVAFGSTHHPGNSAQADKNLAALVASKAPAAALVGKTWEIHVHEALRVSSERYLDVAADSVAYLKQHMKEVFFDAEHFFDGMASSPEYAMAVLKRAYEAGADCLVLCDTNGGRLPSEITAAVKAVRKALPGATLGIHTHNDCGLAVATSLAAVDSGATMVQGTINGIGERCGNTDLCALIPVLELKSGGKYTCLPEDKLKMLRAISNYAAEVANLTPFSRQPFVGRSAFAHKGGVHVSAVNRNSTLYEHINPVLVGNEQRILLTELAGRSNIVSMARRFGFHLDKDEPVVKGLLAELKQKASCGYDYAAAEASVELLLLRKLGRRGVRDFFRLIQFRVLESKATPDSPPLSEATVTLEVEGAVEHTAAFGEGPVNALDKALRKALYGFYPQLKEMRLVDFKVRVLAGSDKHKGTGSLVRVLIESADQQHKWVTVGVSFNIIEASWQALIDSVTYKLYKDENEKRGKQLGD
ncbi:citramalate synthase [Desulfovibrio sp. OttesenSCG-928-G15]|nr:citramalate synthase [Desulfovibrio sp. OttesenSCG-928-G15]